MTKEAKITCLFVDIGGVLLSDGWDHNARKRAAEHFGLDLPKMEERHHIVFETFEVGKLTMEEYLHLVIFYQERSFTETQFRDFMFAQSTVNPLMIELITHLKVKHGLKIAIVSNEACELNAYRIQKFKLNNLADFFISSCFVHLRKPDAEIFRMALDIAQVPASQIVYIENTAMFVEIAEGMGIQGIIHTDYQSTCDKLSKFGLK